MRILQIVPSISLVYGGPSQMVLGLSAALAQQGVEVTVLTTNTNGDAGQPPLDVPLNQPIQQDGYQVIYFSSSFRRYKFSLDLVRWLSEHVSEFDLAHIHALFSPVSTAAAKVARQKKLPYILRPLGTLDPADLQKKKQIKQIYATFLERSNLAGAAAIHFTSVQEAKISERFGVSTPSFVIPLGVNSSQLRVKPNRDYVRLGIPSEVPLVLFMSRIDPKKGLDLLIPALENLFADNINFHLVIAGTNPQDPAYEQQIRDKVEASPLVHRTTMTGFATGELKAGLLKDADLFVLPSYYENFGIAVAEAMAAGTPVVISEQVYIWEDVLNAKAGWVSRCEVDSLTETLRLALKDTQERQLRGLNAQNYASKYYSWDAIAKQTIQAYNQILNK